ncbi:MULTISPECIES: RNA methyltransferase [unclassified Sphingobacterium]|uniref:TrmH family RNA methyltransferase n=1 Tax=unclassified Sphingobacterium TaxID=2609468 RepID=UPI00104D471C|nr:MULTISPECIES: RNA methyltransferase [unclassified Sphingobacterium]MBB2952482.1 TrmH family RNA methyltransferase [Sphingobacterium sp. JUb56]MCS3557469.1 TrmH family RNA methyltransferase [Sphingobacterium sp. JUb21]TCQ96243.1 TrmH family RNA methyltransferase [Sphingobacterium sp. JUb20]
MLSKAQITLISSLQNKKFRKQHGLFIVEGIKSVIEFLSSSYQVDSLFYTEDVLAKVGKISGKIKSYVLTENEFQKISSLKSPQGILALVHIPKQEALAIKDFKGQHTLLLDDIQDPGNLGTIIRTAEWFGFQRILCSIGTVDAYNPKVVQATMGSLSRIEIHYLDLKAFIQDAKLPVFGALLNGDSIYETDWRDEGLLVLGNEGNGISDELIELVDKPVTIPRIGEAESLNVAVATTIFCSEIARTKKL